MRFLALTAVLFSFSSMACPNLAGEYLSCRSLTGSTEAPVNMKITQKLDGGVTIYDVTSTDSETNDSSTESYRADGKMYSSTTVDPDFGTMVQSMTTTCKKDSVSIVGKITMSGQVAVTFTLEQKKINGQLISTMKGQMMGEDLADTIVCE
jgi:hypothetical protein